MKAALESAGFEVEHDAERDFLRFRQLTGLRRSGQFRNGAFTVQAGIDVDEIKREYSNEVVRVASKKFNWAVKKTGQSKYRLARRTY